MSDVLYYAIMILSVTIVALVLHLILHETGHLIGGLLSGYKFVFIRFGSYTLLDDNGKLKFKKFNVPGTAGQCIMKPPVLEKFKFRLYLSGGIIMNVILSILGIVLFLYSSNEILEMLGFELVYMGIVFLLLNGLPLKVGGIVNDGYHVFKIKKNDIPKLYQQLMIGCLDIEGYTFSEMDPLLFECDMNNTANFYDSYLISINGLRFVEMRNYEEARVVFQSLVDDIKCVELFKMNARMMLILLEFLNHGIEAQIDNLLDKKLLKMLKAQKFDLASLLCYYCVLLKENNHQSKDIQQQFIKQSSLVIEKGEVPLFIDLYSKIEQKVK